MKYIYISLFSVLIFTGCTTGSKSKIDYKHYIYAPTTTNQSFYIEEEPKVNFIPREKVIYVQEPHPCSINKEPTITDLSKEIGRKMARKARAAWYAN